MVNDDIQRISDDFNVEIDHLLKFQIISSINPSRFTPYLFIHIFFFTGLHCRGDFSFVNTIFQAYITDTVLEREK